MEIEVYAVGSQVLIDNGISARVVSIQIDQAAVSYKVVWWNERERRTEWVDTWEIQSDSPDARKKRVSLIL